MPTSGSGDGLAARLRARIAEHGPITFAEFMDAALYDPDEGFYSRLVVGEEGDFVTSPHISPLFGSLVARQVEDFWDLLDRPDPFTVVEVGASVGTLAHQVLGAVIPPVWQSIRYVAVERSGEARETARSTGLEVAPMLSDVPAGAAGCVLANELLDNLPFHRVRGTGEGIVELFVALEDERFVLREGPPSSDEIRRWTPQLSPGQDGVVNLEALRFLDSAGALLDRGYVWVVDYGFDLAGASSVHGYRGHRLEEDVLAQPGSRDITAGVDFGALAEHAHSLDLSIWGPVTQREALFALGYAEWEEAARSAQAEYLSERRGIQAMRTFSDRNRARMLIDPGGPGGFYVMCFGVRTGDRPPQAFRNA